MERRIDETEGPAGRALRGRLTADNHNPSIDDRHSAIRHSAIRSSSIHRYSVVNQIGQAFFACSENAAPCGSMALTTQSPPGTSIGPLRILPPLALMRSTAALISGTRK